MELLIQNSYHNSYYVVYVQQIPVNIITSDVYNYYLCDQEPLQNENIIRDLILPKCC